MRSLLPKVKLPGWARTVVYGPDLCPPAKASETACLRHQDLVILDRSSHGKAMSNGLKRFGQALLAEGLPLVGACFSFPGWAAVAGTQYCFRLKSSVTNSTLSLLGTGLVGATAMVGGLLPAVGAAAALALSKASLSYLSTRLQDDPIYYSDSRFALHFAKELASEFGQELPLPESVAPQDGRKILVESVNVALQSLPSPKVAELAGRVRIKMETQQSREHDQQCERFLSPSLPSWFPWVRVAREEMRAFPSVYHYPEPPRLRVVANSSAKIGWARNGDVGISLGVLCSPPRRRFVVGHEIGHLESQDALRDQGVSLLVAALQDELKHQPDNTGLKRLISDVEAQQRQFFHQTEFAADRRGAEMALHFGHSPRQIVATVERSLGRTKASDTHPSGPERVAQVAKFLGVAQPSESSARRRRQPD